MASTDIFRNFAPVDGVDSRCYSVYTGGWVDFFDQNSSGVILSHAKTYYVCGPMRGIYAFNFPAFDAATARLRAAGHRVFNPAERDRAGGFDPVSLGLKGTDKELKERGFDVREAAAYDLEFICREATHLYLLRGWQNSVGAAAEIAVAKWLGLTFEEEKNALW